MATTDDTRTLPNPQDVAGLQLLAKVVATPSPGNMLRTTAEIYDTRVETEWFSDRAKIAFGSLRYDTLDSDAVDTQNRLRVSLDHTLAGGGSRSRLLGNPRPDQRHVADNRP